MASFSIQDLLGLSGKDGRTPGGNGNIHNGFFGKSSPAAAAKEKDDEESRRDGTAREEDHDIDVETFDEDNAHQLVTVEVRTVRHSSSVSRSSSRKRKRAQPAKEREATPDSDDEQPHDGHLSPNSPGYSCNTAKDDSKSSKRLRTAFSTAQLRALEYSFRMCPYPDSYGREQIAKATGIDEAKIQVWFQNRRARYRKREKPLEPQKSPAGHGPSPSPSPISPHSMMQAFFTAAALSSAKLPPTSMPSPHHFYPPSSPFFSPGFAAMPPYSYPPYFTYPTSSPTAAAHMPPQHQPQTTKQPAAKDA